MYIIFWRSIRWILFKIVIFSYFLLVLFSKCLGRFPRLFTNYGPIIRECTFRTYFTVDDLALSWSTDKNYKSLTCNHIEYINSTNNLCIHTYIHTYECIVKTKYISVIKYVLENIFYRIKYLLVPRIVTNVNGYYCNNFIII